MGRGDLGEHYGGPSPNKDPDEFLIRTSGFPEYLASSGATTKTLSTHRQCQTLSPARYLVLVFC